MLDDLNLYYCVDIISEQKRSVIIHFCHREKISKIILFFKKS
jgi:hypothetical protein